MKKLKTKIPKKVKAGDVFTLSSGEYDEHKTDCVMQAVAEFYLIEAIKDWQSKNTSVNLDKYCYLDLDVSDSGVDFLQYLQTENLAVVLPFFDLHDNCLYSDDYEYEIKHANWNIK